MVKIDEILKMLSTDNPKEIQEKGIELGKQVTFWECFIMPYDANGSEKLWENCAKIITSQPLKTTYEYINIGTLYFLLDWLKDMKNPGAKEIYNYLLTSSQYLYEDYLLKIINEKIEESKVLKNNEFLETLNKLKAEKENIIKSKLKIDIDEILKNIYGIYIPNTQEITNTKENINKAIEEGKKIKCLDSFILPYFERGSKGVWDECAIILSSKTDEELKPYIRKIMTYLQDLNWPGSLKIFERLIKIKGKWFDEELNYMLDYTKQIKDECFYEVLEELKVERNKKQEKD